MLVFKVLHILSMFTMVTVFLGSEFFYAFAIRQRDVRALAWVHRTVRQGRVAVVGLVALIAGVAFGLLAAGTGGLDFFKGWLIAAYVLVALFLVNSAVLGEKLIRLADQAVEADAGKRPTDQVVRDMTTSAAFTFFAMNGAIFAAIILDMVLKPFE